jgi:hypothetical protein
MDAESFPQSPSPPAPKMSRRERLHSPYPCSCAGRNRQQAAANSLSLALPASLPYHVHGLRVETLSFTLFSLSESQFS